MDAKLIEWLKSLKPGDEVAVVQSQYMEAGNVHISTVVKITPTGRISVAGVGQFHGGQYRCEYMVGSGIGKTHGALQEPTPELRQQAVETTKRLAEERARAKAAKEEGDFRSAILCRLFSLGRGSVMASTDQLRRIAAILDEKEGAQ